MKQLLIERFGSSVIAEEFDSPKLDDSFQWGFESIRVKGPDEAYIDRIFQLVLPNHIRYNLWGNSIARPDFESEVYPDSMPLRFWLPFRFVEPIRSVSERYAISYQRSWRWTKAPFEVRQIVQDDPCLNVKYFTQKYRVNGFGTTDVQDGGWVGQIVCKLENLSKPRFAIRTSCNQSK